MKIDELREKIANFLQSLESGALLDNIILDNENVITELNSEEQLYEYGENALGVSIMDYAPYSPITIEIKKQMGQPYNRVTLRDTGDFEKSFFIEARGTEFEIMANDFKTEKLIKRYGRQIMGLNDENRQELVDNIIYPNLIEKLKDQIQ